MAQVAKVVPSATAQNILAPRTVAHSRSASKSSDPSFVPIDELNAALDVAAYGEAAIFQETNRDDAPPRGNEAPFTAPSQVFANIVEEGQVPGEWRATGDSRRKSTAIVNQAISAYEASARINTGARHPRGQSLNTNY